MKLKGKIPAWKLPFSGEIRESSPPSSMRRESARSTHRLPPRLSAMYAALSEENSASIEEIMASIENIYHELEDISEKTKILNGFSKEMTASVDVFHIS